MIPENHRKITSDALSGYLNANTLDLVKEANVDSDQFFKSKKDLSDGYVVNAQHFNKADLSECEDFLKKAEQVVIDDFIKAVKTPDGDQEQKNYIKAFYDLGRLTHCIQDFYSHTNWINQTGNTVSVWNKSVTDPNIDNPKKLKTGRYSDFFQCLQAINIFKNAKLKKGKKYNNTYVENTNQSHFILNKDEKGSIADEAFKAVYGVSGYDLAAEDATLHTNYEWKELSETLEEKLGSEAYNELVEDMKNLKPTTKEFEDIKEDCRKHFNEEMKE